MTELERKQQISAAVTNFQGGNLRDSSLNLFESLGYKTSRGVDTDAQSFEELDREFELQARGLNYDNAHVDEWTEVQLLFQLTAEEMNEQMPAFQPTIERDEPASFLFFAIELQGASYSRTKLAEIARQLNKPFPMDVFVLFRYGNFLTLSLIERRPHKKLYDRDVIEKVTHIYNIDVTSPHAGHIQILYTFSLQALTEQSKRRTIESFKDLQALWKRAIGTQILNKQFYRDYSSLSRSLIQAIHPTQIAKKMPAHQGVLNLLNRIMFIYFVQKKKWLMNDSDFIGNFWERYIAEGHDGEDKFHKHWLNTVFFYAFNSRLWDARESLGHLPEDLKLAFTTFPYLNGGLFAKSQEYDNFILPDKHFKDIFDFFNGYIFTITEDTPYDVNLEINPELLGKMYEGMINATDLNDVEAENGIVYTERPEINFMVRRSLVEVLDKKLNELQNANVERSFTREFLYRFIFDTPSDKLLLLRRNRVDVSALRRAITTLTACDPACGSGSMLVGVITVQIELLRVIDEYQGSPHSSKDDFKIKKQLISECIYGVDVKEWAVRIAELRLWLYMIAEVEFTAGELTTEPLLPNLDFKLRVGNSLIQKFGDLDFTIEDLLNGRRRNVGAARQLNEYIKRKKAFIQNQGDSNTTYQQLKEEERVVFLDFIRELITEKEQGIHSRQVRQSALFGNAEQADLFTAETEKLTQEIEQLKKLRKLIVQERRLPFSYDVDFMEVFLAKADDPGFDLIIGNPPYVRQEDILPPEDAELLEELLRPENRNRKAETSKSLKKELNSRVYKIYPFLSSTVNTEVEGEAKTINVYGKTVPGRSDLYVYFQLICPHYLNSKGTFCFIISNSWLDTDFGSFIQQFLLKHTSLQTIYDCNVRSFEASINTIIYLHNAILYPRLQGGRSGLYKLAESVDNTVRFVMNKVNYIDAAYAPLLIDQEHCIKSEFNDIYRCLTVSQEELFKQGYNEDAKRYTGNKIGGYYFRAPEVYYSILNKGSNKLIKLKEISDVRFGVKTGANDFFFLPSKFFELHFNRREAILTSTEQNPNELTISFNKALLKPILFSLKEVVYPELSLNELSRYYFSSNKSKLQLGTAKKYVQWGEENEYHQTPTCRSRSPWYFIEGNFRPADFIFPSKVGERFFTMDNRTLSVLEDKKQYGVIVKSGVDQNALLHFLNTTLYRFMVELMAPQLTGAQAIADITTSVFKNSMVFDFKNIKLKKTQKLSTFMRRRSESIFIELDSIRNSQSAAKHLSHSPTERH